MNTAESVAFVRDIVLIIFGGMAIVAFGIITVLAMLTYRKITSVLDSIRATSRNIREASDRVLQPFIGGGPSMTYGLGELIGLFLGLSREKGGKNDA